MDVVSEGVCVCGGTEGVTRQDADGTGEWV